MRFGKHELANMALQTTTLANRVLVNGGQRHGMTNRNGTDSMTGIEVQVPARARNMRKRFQRVRHAADWGSKRFRVDLYIVLGFSGKLVGAVGLVLFFQVGMV